MTPETRLLLATTNPAKAERLRWVLEGLGFSMERLGPDDGPGPDEDGRGFRANAELKARYWSRRRGRLAAASDGGLVIPALGSRWNALRTARAAGPAADDLTRARHLLGLAAELRGRERRVVWAEGLALARAGRLLASWQAEGTEAVLLEHIRAEDLKPGFWAASLCYVPALWCTLAALDEAALERADPTGSRLRAAARAYFGSTETDDDLRVAPALGVSIETDQPVHGQVPQEPHQPGAIARREPRP